MHFLAWKPLHFLLFSSLLILLQSPTTAEDPTFILCPSSSNYTSGSPFQTNLNRLLSSLSPNGSIDLNGYYNATYGEDPDLVYGFSQCMSGATEDACRECLQNSMVEIIRRCPNGKDATIRYYNCILRYSSRPFFSELEDDVSLALASMETVTNQTVFNRQLDQLMRNLWDVAESRPSKYAQEMIRLVDFENIYGVAQCTRDLPEGKCTSCLQEMIEYIPKCCGGKKGAEVYSVSCNIRYETFPFFDSSPSPPLPPSTTTSPPPSNSDSDTSNGDGNKKRSRMVIIVVVSVLVALVAISSIWACLLHRMMKFKRSAMRVKPEIEDKEIIMVELLFFNLDTLKDATANFSNENKLGQGRFGAVYKGKLYDGTEIAVKRLSITSVLGKEELQNEVTLVAKLQHSNLVSLWGCCLEQQEKLLIYEYVPNTSLDTFLFDPIKRIQLDWKTRYKIIKGIAQGVLYLHEDSQLKIIHRDLKASNVLLDENMNPKIADFGMARLFGGDQTQGNTSHIAGTYGYMAPEYAMYGQFSTKSDVFSFGVLVLEMVTGRKNTPFDDAERPTNLLSYAWRHWTEGAVLDITDETIVDQCSRSELFRCIHMALLCVQEDANERPPNVYCCTGAQYPLRSSACPIATSIFGWD